MDRNDIVSMVIDAVRDEVIAASNDGGAVIDLDEDTPLLGEAAPIDSLGLVSVIVQVEESLAAADAGDISLVDEKAMSQRNSPFRSVGALASYAWECLGATGQDAAAR